MRLKKVAVVQIMVIFILDLTVTWLFMFPFVLGKWMFKLMYSPVASVCV